MYLASLLEEENGITKIKEQLERLKIVDFDLRIFQQKSFKRLLR